MVLLSSMICVTGGREVGSGRECGTGPKQVVAGPQELLLAELRGRHRTNRLERPSRAFRSFGIFEQMITGDAFHDVGS